MIYFLFSSPLPLSLPLSLLLPPSFVSHNICPRSRSSAVRDIKLQLRIPPPAASATVAVSGARCFRIRARVGALRDPGRGEARNESGRLQLSPMPTCMLRPEWVQTIQRIIDVNWGTDATPFVDRV